VVDCPKTVHHVGLFCFSVVTTNTRMDRVDKPTLTMAQQIAEAASAFEQRRTGRVPDLVTVVLSAKTLIISLHGVLSPAERAIAKTPDGATRMQEFHRLLFASSSEPFRQNIEEIIGAEVHQSDGRIEAASIVPVFPAGIIVQVFLLADSLPTETWSGIVARREEPAGWGVPGPAASKPEAATRFIIPSSAAPQ
jgi:uncharacterized protein YbcI